MTNSYYPIQRQVPYTIRGNSAFLIMLIIFWCVLLIGAVYAYLVQGLHLKYLLAYIIGVSVFILWTRFVRIIVSYSGVTFHPGFIRQFDLDWVDIQTISMGLQVYGTHGEKLMTLHTNNPSKIDIRINYFCFRRTEIFIFLQNVIAKNPQVALNNEAIDFMKRSEKEFSKPHAG
jgi:hypothetical protein